MRIVADADIPYVEEAFGRLGDVTALPAKRLTPEAVREADALLVRSVTRVDATLLEGSRIRFVGTATSGVDHVDLAYLRELGVRLATAAGANANAVAEYVVAALLHVAAQRGVNLSESSLGIIGLGRVGRRVARYAASLGLTCIPNDPPLARSTAEPLYRPLDEVFECDVVTLHVPLERGGPDPTYHLVDAEFLERLGNRCVLINTSRGSVVDTQALMAATKLGEPGACIFDVWENEPCIDPGLVDVCALATPHIAGHTWEAKAGATKRLFDALRSATGSEVSWEPTEDTNAENVRTIDVHVAGIAGVRQAALQATGMLEWDRTLRDSMALDPDARARAFADMRSQAPTRREFGAWRVVVDGDDVFGHDLLCALGFQVVRRVEAAGVHPGEARS